MKWHCYIEKNGTTFIPCFYCFDSCHSLSPAISKSLEPVTSQLSNTVAAKLSAVEATLKENVTKVIKSKVCVCVCTQTLFRCHSLINLQDCFLPIKFKLVYRTQQTPLDGQRPKRCREQSRRPIRKPSRRLCCLCSIGAVSLCSSRSTTASNRAHKTVCSSTIMLFLHSYIPTFFCVPILRKALPLLSVKKLSFKN